MRRSVLAALFGAAACYGVVAITEPPGPGLDPDSMSYLGVAESLAHHRGLRVPISGWSDADSTSSLAHFPPGFPILIAAPVALGADAIQSSRAIIAGSAFVTVALAVWLVSGVAGVGAGALAGLVLLASPSYAFDHWQVISEPLCLALLMATLGLMARNGRPWLYGSTAALAGMVRYAALSAIGAAVLWAFGLPGTLRERVRRAALAALPAVLLQGLWAGRSAAESGQTQGLAWQGGMGSTLRELGETVRAWLAPSVPASPVALLVATAVACGGCLLVVGAIRGVGHGAPEAPAPEAESAPVARFIAAAGLLAACYAAVVLASRMFVYGDIPFDPRLLSPLILLVEIATAAALGAAWKTWRPRMRTAVGATVVVWLAASAWATVAAVADAIGGGWGYSSDEWRASRLGEWLRTDGASAPLFSNDPAAVYFLTQRPSRDLPSTLDPESTRDFGRVLVERRGVLVRFPNDYEPVAPPDSLARRLGLRQVASFPEGIAWVASRP